MSVENLSEEIISKIDDLIAKEMTLKGTPGLSIGIISEDKLICTRNYGAIDLSENKPATSDSLYMIASITKSFTCIGILKLIEQVKLSLDDEVSKYVPLKLGFDDDPIRIRHIMSHCSGIPDLTDPLWDRNLEELSGLSFEIPKIPFTTWDDIFRHINGARDFISERPGKIFYYNNMAFNLLGRIIELVSSTPYSDFIKKEILNPLEMTSSSYFNSSLEKNPNLATPYVIDPNSKVGKLIPRDYPEQQLISAAGGLFSTINDMSKYVIMHLNKGNYNGKQILNKTHLTEMQKMYFVESYPNNDFTSFYGKYGNTGYGLGLVIHDDFFGNKLVQHSGSYYGSSTWMAFLPDEKLGVVFLSNKHPSPRMLAQAVLMLLIGRDPKVDHPLIKLRNHHDKLTGVYSTYKSVLTRKVISKDGALFLKFNDKKLPPQPLYPIYPEKLYDCYDYYVITEIGGQLPLKFEIGDDGKVWIHVERQKWRRIKDL